MYRPILTADGCGGVHNVYSPGCPYVQSQRTAGDEGVKRSPVTHVYCNSPVSRYVHLHVCISIII